MAKGPPTKKPDGRPLRKDGGGGPAPKAGPKRGAKTSFAERLADRTKENKSKLTPDQKAVNDFKAAEGRKRKAEEAAAPLTKRERADFRSMSNAEKGKIKCKFWNSDPTKNKCTGSPCLFKHM